MHLEPGFARLFDKQPAVGLAGIEEKLAFAAFTAGLARFDPYRNAHRIDLSSAMDLGCG